jgi:hypothetical protein
MSRSRTLRPQLKKLVPYTRLMTVVAIGLQKPFAKLESGANLIMYDVYWLVMLMFIMDFQLSEQNTSLNRNRQSDRLK